MSNKADKRMSKAPTLRVVSLLTPSGLEIIHFFEREIVRGVRFVL